MRIDVLNQQKDLKFKSTIAKTIVKEVLAYESFETDEVTLYFVSDEQMRQLHQDFFNDPTPTDCISFPIDGIEERHLGSHLLGEIFICPKTAIRYLGAEATMSSIYQETTLYLIHGLLHLLGYDDLTPKDRKKMKLAEQRILDHLISNNLLLR